MTTKKLYEVTFNHGLHSPFKVEAESVDEAKRLGLAEYRKNCTMIDNFSINFVVADAVELI